MELQEFVKQTLVQIVRGIEEGNKELTGNTQSASGKPFLLVYSGGDNPKAPHIQFDVAVTTKVDHKAKAGISGKLWVVDANAGVFRSSAKENVSRVQFSVLVAEHQG